MAAYRRVYDTRHLQADCQGTGSAPEPYTLSNRVRTTFHFFSYRRRFLEEILASNVSCVATLDGRGGDRPGQSSAGAGVPRALIVIGRNDCTDRDGLAD